MRANKAILVFLTIILAVDMVPLPAMAAVDLAPAGEVFGKTTSAETCALSPQAVKSYASQPISKRDPAVVIRVSYATSTFNKGVGGTICAAPVKQQSGYRLYDVVLWPDRISCYMFPKDYFDILNDYFDAHGRPTSLAKYEKTAHKVREKYCIYTSKVKCGKTENVARSKAKWRAFVGIFKAVKKRTPSHHVVLKYSGHGGGGCLFDAIDLEYTKKTLADGVKVFNSKFALIDYGTNCASARAATLDMYAPYTDYMVMCQQNWGGWEWNADAYKSDGSIKESYLHLDSDSRYHTAFKAGTTAKTVAKKIARLNKAEWTDLASDYIKKNKVMCSNVAVDTKAFAAFRKAMKKAGFDDFVNNPDEIDLYVKIRKNKNLSKLYKKSIVGYVSTRNLGVKWTAKEYGISLYAA